MGTTIGQRISYVRRELERLAAELDDIEKGLLVESPPVGTYGEDGKTAAERIRMTRKSKGMTQAELARRIGMTPSQLCKIELGTSDLTASTGRRIAVGLGVSLPWLLCGVEA